MIYGNTVVWVKSNTKEELIALKQNGESFDELVRKMIVVYKNYIQNSTKK